MSYVRDRAIVLKNEPFRDEDAWIVFYSRSNGKMEAVARGVRRWTAKHVGHLEPFAEVDVMIAKGAAFDKVAVAKTVQPHRGVRTQLTGMTVLGAFVSCVETMTRPGMADPEVYDLLQELSELLGTLTVELTPERGRLLFAAASLKLMDLLGYAPEIGEASRQADVLKVGRFLRERPLAEALRLTLPVGMLRAVGGIVEEAFEQTPLPRAPHGPETIAQILSFS